MPNRTTANFLGEEFIFSSSRNFLFFAKIFSLSPIHSTPISYLLSPIS